MSHQLNTGKNEQAAQTSAAPERQLGGHDFPPPPLHTQRGEGRHMLSDFIFARPMILVTRTRDAMRARFVATPPGDDLQDIWLAFVACERLAQLDGEHSYRPNHFRESARAAGVPQSEIDRVCRMSRTQLRRTAGLTGGRAASVRSFVKRFVSRVDEAEA